MKTRFLPLLFLAAIPLHAQQAGLAAMDTPFLDTSTGIALPCVGCTVKTYLAGTSTPTRTYTDSSLTSQNGVSITLNSAGYSTSGVWIGSQCIKFSLVSALGVTLRTQDNICDNAQAFRAAQALPTFLMDSGFGSFASACTSAISGGQTLAIASTLTVPAGTYSCSLWFLQGGKLRVAAGATVALTGTVTCPSTQQCFDTTTNAGAALTIAASSMDAVTFRQFGAAGTGSGDDTGAIKAAYAAVQGAHGKIQIGCGIFPLSAELTISSRIDLEGGGDGDSGTVTHSCSQIKKTADVIGIHIVSGAGYTTLKDFQLTSTAGSGTSDGIVIGDADATNGAGEVRIENVTVDHHKGNGINVRNGNSGVINHVKANANGGNGVLISNQQTSAFNTNAWRVQNSTALSNTLTGFNFNVAGATVASGLDSEGNGQYGVFAGQASISIIGGDVESNVGNDIVTNASCFGCFIFLNNVANRITQGSPFSWIVNGANALGPYVDPLTGNMGVRGTMTIAGLLAAAGVTGNLPVTGNVPVIGKLDATGLSTFRQLNYIGTETGANNALVVSLKDSNAVNVPLADGLRIGILLGHTLAAGAGNTIVFNGSAAQPVCGHRNPGAFSLTAGYAASATLEVIYSSTFGCFLDVSQ